MLDQRIIEGERMVRAAGDLLKRHFQGSVEIRQKSAIDLVTSADLAAERLIMGRISNHFPEDSVIAEESGARRGSSAYTWVVDPLDGTTNFAHGMPHFAVSVGLQHEHKIVSGWVFDPMKDELFEAHLGFGARCNRQPIGTKLRFSLAECLCVSGFPYDRRERLDHLLERVKKALMHCRGFRRLGAASLDLAYVAAGRLDIYWEDGLKPWDMAAGWLIAAEAGAQVTRLNGTSFDLYDGQVLAAHPNVLASFVEQVLT
ncbi:MAG: inositol monophosphatase [Acidobacteria bacterium]|nr:inositol monophosphatase [Acidobacteriota bacterium]